MLYILITIWGGLLTWPSKDDRKRLCRMTENGEDCKHYFFFFKCTVNVMMSFEYDRKRTVNTYLLVKRCFYLVKRIQNVAELWFFVFYAKILVLGQFFIIKLIKKGLKTRLQFSGDKLFDKRLVFTIWIPNKSFIWIPTVNW